MRMLIRYYINGFVEANSRVWVEGESETSDSFINTIIRDYLSHLGISTEKTQRGYTYKRI